MHSTNQPCFIKMRKREEGVFIFYWPLGDFEWEALQGQCIYNMKKETQNFEEIQTNQTVQSRLEQSYRHFGLTLPIGMLPNGEPKYILGPHYWVFMLTLLITSLLFSIMGYKIASQAKQHQLGISLALTFVMGFYIYSYFKVGTSNPGIASSVNQGSIRYCKPCKIVRPLGTVHCFSCDVCVFGYDHHCPWIGKCVGRDNMCDFKRFLFSIMLAIGTFAGCIYLSGNTQGNVVK